MASKRTHNRMYWAVVKAVSTGDTYAPSVYQFLLIHNWTDRDILPYIEWLEAKHGKHKPHVDLHNSGLWDSRKTVDGIRNGK